MYENRGPEARLRQGLETLIATAERLPPLVESLEKLVTAWSREGVMLHAETLVANAAHRARGLIFLLIPLWAAAALVAIAVVLALGR
jgi:ubiquinone biosynthesis protein